MTRFTVVLTPEPDGTAWNVTVPALPGCRTWGETIEQALAMAKDAIAAYLADGPTELPAAGEAVIATVEVPIQLAS